ncbi:MAG: hypothetical protein IZT56_05370 [Bacteroidetes bacterium]|nr:hypothetical protein [Bacteroidota bacterium]
MRTTFCILLSFFLTTTILFGQTTKKFIDTGSVSNQFDYLVTKSYNYKDYKNVKTEWILKLKSNVIDSISASNKKVTNANSIINAQIKSIDSLNSALKTSANSILKLKNETQSISFIGMELEKSLFKTILISIIAVLTILLLFFISKFKMSNSVTTQVKQDLKELDEEFETHRKTALEREQKVRRQLQDELNKQKKDN